MSDAPAARPLRMDPRIRERRIAVRRDEGRRRLRLVVAAATAVALAGAAYGVTRSPLLDVDAIRVRGTTMTAPMAVAAAGRLNHHPQLMDVDPKRTASRIERLPWVERATVVRHWPATVEVTVVERTAVVAVPSAAGGWAAVDGSGRVLAVAPAAPAGLVTVTPTGSVAAAPAPGSRVGPGIRAAVAVVEALPSTLSSRVTTARVLADDGQLELVLDAGAVVSFGRAEDVRAKLVALTTLVERTNLKGVRTIDVRVPTAPVLTRA